MTEVTPEDLNAIPKQYRRTIATWLAGRGEAASRAAGSVVDPEGRMSRFVGDALKGAAVDLIAPLAEDSTVGHANDELAKLGRSTGVIIDYANALERETSRTLAKARQELACEGALSPCPPWAELTRHEQDLAMVAARNYIRAAHRCGLIPEATWLLLIGTRRKANDTACWSLEDPDLRELTGNETVELQMVGTADYPNLDDELESYETYLDQMPPIWAWDGGPRPLLITGTHRSTAAHRRGIREIPAWVVVEES